VKQALSFGPSSQSSGSHSSDTRSESSAQSSSFVASPQETAWSSHHLAHDGVPVARDNGDISIITTAEMEKYESLRHQEFAHTHVYDVNLHERVYLDEELPTILRTIGWGKLYDEPCLGSRHLTHEFLISFETFEKNKKSFVKFRLFRKSFGCDFSRFS
jgi:hypothetical protein